MSGRAGGPAPRPPATSATGGGTNGPRTALLVAIAADAIQLAALPAFAPGLASPLANALDVVVAIVMVRLLGWHWAFLPTFLVEVVPFVNLAPTWTLAVWIASRGRGGAPRG